MTPELLPSLFMILAVLRYAFGIITDEQRLHHEIMQERHFSKLIKPPGEGDNNTLTVKIAMRLSELLYVSERNQIVTTKMWLRHEWYDVRMKWDPTDFGNITYTHFPIEDMWRPDIVLYNNADGDFEVTLLIKAYVMYTGMVIWEPPAIYKSYCPINVEYFPFDEQECFFKFSSWAYDGIEVDLRHVWEEERGIRENNHTRIPMGVDLCDYSQNFEWDIINVTATRKVKFYPCCPNMPYPDITFWITIRRKTLFYTVNLIMPIVAISTLTALVFYLPSESGEKITLSISILLALTVFFLLLSDINPPTSLVIPLIGKYLLFTMIVVTMSIFLTVYTLSVHFRSPATHKMTPWTRKLFIEILPQVLCMKRPDQEDIKLCNLMDDIVSEGTENKKNMARFLLRQHYKDVENLNSGEAKFRRIRSIKSIYKYPDKIKASLRGLTYIAEHMKNSDKEKKDMLDWNYVAMVMDRLFLFLFTSACTVGTLTIFLSAPSIHNPLPPLTRSDLFCSRR